MSDDEVADTEESAGVTTLGFGFGGKERRDHVISWIRLDMRIMFVRKQCDV